MAEEKHASPLGTQIVVAEEKRASPLLRNRLGDMNPLTFWIITGIIALVIVGASVGGAVGGTLAVRNSNFIARYVAEVLCMCSPLMLEPCLMSRSPNHLLYS